MPFAPNIELQTLIDEYKYTIPELARSLRVHRSTIYRAVVNEPGTIRLRQGKRRVLRIPESVVRRVFGQMTVGQSSLTRPDVPGRSRQAGLEFNRD
jgi:hypothetical protein